MRRPSPAAWPALTVAASCLLGIQPLGSLALNRTGGGGRDAPAGEQHVTNSEQ